MTRTDRSELLARPAPAVYVHRDGRTPRWCVVRAAHPGGRIWLACGDSISCGPALIGTGDPGELGCAACRAAIAACAADPRGGA